MREPAIELFIPLRMAAEPHGNVVRNHFEYAANGIAEFVDGVHFGFHFTWRAASMQRTERRIEVGARGANLFPGCGVFQAHMADLNGVAGDFRPKLAEE